MAHPKSLSEILVGEILHVLPPVKVRSDPRPGIRVVVLPVEPLLAFVTIPWQRATLCLAVVPSAK